MFIGHFALALGAKNVQPRVSLGHLFLSVQFLDLLWPTFLLTGLETVEISPGITRVTPLDFNSYPYSHSLLFAGIWGVVLGTAYWLWKKDKGGALLVGIGVVSHWMLDLIVHRPDLPLYPGDSPKFGLGLWNSVWGSQSLEFLFLAVGIALYLRRTQAKNRQGSFGFWGLAGFLVFIQCANVFGPPPTDVTAIAWGAQLQWLIVLWAYWVDRNRTAA